MALRSARSAALFLGPQGPPGPPGTSSTLALTLQGVAIAKTPIGTEGQALVVTNGVYTPAGVETVVNVRSFGAVGDGVTDDTAAINTAIGALPARGGVLYFPGLQYKFMSTLATPPSNTVIRGATTGTYTSQPASQLVTPNDVAAFAILDRIALIFERIGFLCTHSTPTAQAITLTDSPYCHFEHVAIQGFGYGLVFDHVPLASASSFNTTLFACNIISNATTNIYAKANSSANALVMIGTEFGGASQNGLVFLDSDNLSIMGGGCEETALLAIDIDNTNGARLQCGDSITGCHFEYSGASTPATAMIRVGHSNACEGGVISGCVFVTNNNVAPGPPILFTPGNSKNWVEVGNTNQGFTPVPAGQSFAMVATTPIYAPRRVRAIISATTYTINSVELDEMIPVSSGANAVLLTLPPPALGLHFTVADVGGAAAGRLITVQQNASELIYGTALGGLASVTVPGNYGHLTFACLDGSNWWVLDGTVTTSVGQVYASTFTTTGNGQVDFILVPEPAVGHMTAWDVRIAGEVTIGGSSSVATDCIFYESQVVIKNVATVMTSMAQTTGNPNVFADTSQQGTQAGLLGYQGSTVGFAKIGVQQGGAPNVGASIRWVVSAQVASNN